MPRINVMINQHSKYYQVLQNEITGVDKKVFLAIVKHMEIDTNLITLLGATLSIIIDELAVSKQQVRNATSNLAVLHLLEPTRTLRGEYIVNPSLAWKGNEDKVWKFYTKFEFQLRDQLTKKATNESKNIS